MPTHSLNNGFAMKRWPEPEVWAEARSQIKCASPMCSCRWISSTSRVRPRGSRLRRHASARPAQMKVSSFPASFRAFTDYSANMLLHPDGEMRLAALERYKRGIEFCALVGADTFGGHMGAYSVADYGNPARRQALAEEQLDHVSALSDHAAAGGATLCFVGANASGAEVLRAPLLNASGWPSGSLAWVEQPSRTATMSVMHAGPICRKRRAGSISLAHPAEPSQSNRPPAGKPMESATTIGALPRRPMRSGSSIRMSFKTPSWQRQLVQWLRTLP